MICALSCWAKRGSPIRRDPSRPHISSHTSTEHPRTHTYHFGWIGLDGTTPCQHAAPEGARPTHAPQIDARNLRPGPPVGHIDSPRAGAGADVEDGLRVLDGRFVQLLVEDAEDELVVDIHPARCTRGSTRFRHRPAAYPPVPLPVVGRHVVLLVAKVFVVSAA